MALPNRASKAGYAKIVQSCRLARNHGHEYIWIDSCAIDKSSSAELTESINSMFQWYKNATVCYAFLEDLSPYDRAEEMVNRRWFTRGWTLQELIAPENVEFYDAGWNHRGSRLNLKDIISKCTSVPPRLLGENRKSLDSFSIATRMSWAAQRQTTRIEDTAYCLLGIFNVNMSLIYGEGVKAFRRLQEQIIKQSNDLTIFGWESTPSRDHADYPIGLFATSPKYFTGSSTVRPFLDDFVDFGLTNKGLSFSGDVPLRVAAVATGHGYELETYFICLGSAKRPNINYHDDGRICLRKLGPHLYYRNGRFSLVGFGRRDRHELAVFEVKSFYIVADPSIDQIDSIHSSFRADALHISVQDRFRLAGTAPEALWDITDRVFLRPSPYKSVRYPMLLCVAFNATIAESIVEFVIVCDFKGDAPICKLFDRQERPRLAEYLFSAKNQKDFLYWTEIDDEKWKLSTLEDTLQYEVGKQTNVISVSVNRGRVEEVSAEVSLYSLQLDVSKY